MATVRQERTCRTVAFGEFPPKLDPHSLSKSVAILLRTGCGFKLLKDRSLAVNGTGYKDEAATGYSGHRWNVDTPIGNADALRVTFAYL